MQDIDVHHKINSTVKINKPGHIMHGKTGMVSGHAVVYKTRDSGTKKPEIHNDVSIDGEKHLHTFKSNELEKQKMSEDAIVNGIINNNVEVVNKLINNSILQKVSDALATQKINIAKESFITEVVIKD